MKLISIIVLTCFIFTNIPVKGYAGTANSYSLRRRAAEDERDNLKNIKDALENADQNNLSNLLALSLEGSQEKGGLEAYSKLKQLALQSPGSLIDYFESLLPQAVASLPEDLFGKGYGYDLRGNALPIPKGIVDLTPINCYIFGKALGKMYARKGDKVLITGDQRWHTPVLRLATALGFISAGIDAEFSEEILGTGEHGLLSGENPYNHRIMIQVSGSHGVPQKNGEKIKIDKGEKGQIRLEPLYAQGLAEVFTKIKEKKLDFGIPEKVGSLKEISGLVDLAVDYLDKTLPQIDPGQPIIFDCRNSALINVLKKIVEKRGLKNVRWFNDNPDPSMPGGIWDPSKSEALVLAKQELEKWNAELKSQKSKYRAVAFIFDGDGDRATAILEDGTVVPAFEMTLPFYQRFISDPGNKEVITKLRKAGYTEKIWLACDIRATSALMSMIDAYSDYAGYYIQPGYPPQRDFVRWRIAELRKFVEANPELLQNQEFMAGFQHFLNTYFTAEASGHQFFHICPNFPDKVIDAGIAVVFNLLYIKKTIPANEAKDDNLRSKLPPQDSFELVDLFKAFPVTISSEEARIVVPNLIKAKLEEMMAKKLKEKYKNELLLTKTGAEKVDDMIIQPKEEGAIEVEGIKVQLKSGGSAMFKKSNTGEQAVLIFEGSTPEELNQIMLDTEGLIKEAVGELAKGAAGNEKIIEACKNVNLDDLRNKRAKAIEKYSVPKARGAEEKSLPTVSEQLEKIYEERGANMDDYYVPPIVVVDSNGELVAKVKKGDVVVFANHRTDRSLETLLALTDPDFNKQGNRFDTENLGLTFIPFTVYDKEYFKTHGIQAAFTSQFTLPPYQSIIEVLHKAGVIQGYFTESDKGQHVTYFFAGQRNLDYASLGIKVSIVPSESVEDKSKNPRMKYAEITENVINYLNEIKRIPKKKVIVVNLPVDIQGHNIKGDKERAKATVLAADEAAGKIREAVLAQKGVYIETSDHGNIEKLATLDENGMPLSDKHGLIPFDQHTTNPVNFIIDGLGKNIKLKQGKGLSNIAATLLEILGISKPKEMNESLLSDYQYQEIEGPVVLVIRDGWGVNKFENKEAKENDGIALALPPVFLDLLNNCPRTTLKAHGDAVGLPDYQMGDSDNGHRVIGTGFNPSTLYKQIIDQIEDGSFFKNPVLLQAFESAKKEKRDIHIMGLYSSGGIHSDNRYFLALMEMAKRVNFSGKVNIWPILDGRDVMTRIPTENGTFYLKQIQDKIAELNLPNIQLAGVIGRNFAMDRDAINRDRDADKTEKLAAQKEKDEAEKLRKEAASAREKAQKLWQERFKPAYRLWVNGEGIPVKLGFDKELGIDAKDFLDANSRFFKAVGGEALLPGYLEDILSQYKVLFHLDDVKLALVIHSSFFKKGGAIEALNKIIKLQPGQIMLGIYGEGGDKIRALFSDSSNVITAKTADELKSKLKNQKGELPMDVVVLKPIGEKIGWEVKQVGFSEKTISTVAVAKAMQVLLGANPEGKSYSGVILNRLKEFYENMKSQKVISNETYEKTKTQVFDGLDLPDIELAQGINGINNNDADVISKFIDSFI